jgi:hypothetical protein
LAWWLKICSTLGRQAHTRLCSKGRLAQPVEQLTLNQPVAGSNPASPIAETPENKALAEPKQSGSVPKSQKLVSGLFSDNEIDADLRVIMKRWPQLSPQLRTAIVKMVKE